MSKLRVCAAAKYRRSINITQHCFLFPINALILIHRSALCREVGSKGWPVSGSIKTDSFVRSVDVGEARVSVRRVCPSVHCSKMSGYVG